MGKTREEGEERRKKQRVQEGKGVQQGGGCGGVGERGARWGEGEGRKALYCVLYYSGGVGE